MKLTREMKVGLLAVVSATVLYIGFNFLKGIDFFSSSYTYYVFYDNVDGLTVSNPVSVNGFAVGRVKDIQILQDRNNKILVTIELNEKLKMGKKTKAVLMDDGLLGSKKIELDIDMKNDAVKDNDTLVSLSESGIMTAITERATPIIDEASAVLKNINKILGNLEGIDSLIKYTIRGYAETAYSAKSMIDENSQQLKSLIKNLNTLTEALVKDEKQFAPILQKIDSFTVKLNDLELKETVQKVNQSLEGVNQIIQGVKNGEGSLGALLHNEDFYNNLNKLSEDLDKLLIDMKKNPKRYIKFSIF